MRRFLPFQHLPAPPRRAFAGQLLAGIIVASLALPALAQPTVTTRNPVRNALSASRPTNVALTFSQAMNAATDQNVRVFSAQRGGRKAGVYATAGSTITFNPTTDFRPGEVVTVVVPTSVTSGVGTPAGKHVYQFTAAAAGNPGGFTVAPPVAVNNPVSTTLADLNNDGNLDLVVTDTETPRLEVRIGAGNGTFTAGATLATTANQADLQAADIDGDGDLDLLAVIVDGTVAVFKNAGNGTFAAAGTVTVGSLPQGLELADIDADGDLDMLVANRNSFSVSVRLNDGTGAFSGNANLSVGAGITLPVDVKAADIDSDGDLDLVVVNRVTNQVRLLTNSGSGVFSLGAALNVGQVPQQCAVGDFDGDGDVDVVTVNGQDNTASVLLNDGTGTFATAATLPTSAAPLRISAADLDGDGDLDLLVSGNTTVSHYNTGTATFGPPSTVINGKYTGLSVGDLDNDNDVDFVAADIFADQVAVRLNGPPMTVTGLNPVRYQAAAPRATNVAVTFSNSVAAATAANMRIFGAQAGGRKAGTFNTASATVTFDPTTNFRPGEVVQVSIPNTVKSATGRLAAPHVYEFVSAATGGSGTYERRVRTRGGLVTTGLALADLNADGYLDAVSSHFGEQSVRVNLGGPGNTFTSGVVLPAGGDPFDVAVGDINADGRLDVTVATTNNLVRVWLNAGNATFQAPTDVLFSDDCFHVRLADMDGDADLDMIVGHHSSSKVSIRLNNGSGTFGPGTTRAVGDLVQGLTVGDVDADGDLDVLVAAALDDQVGVYRNDGFGNLDAGTLLAVGDYPQGLKTADLDADGDLDLVVLNSGSNTVQVFFNDGTGGYLTSTTYPVNGTDNPTDVDLVDVDGDGNLDLLAKTNGGLLVRRNVSQGSLGSQTIISGGGGLAGLATGDLDNDGDLDAMIFTSTEMNLFINQDFFRVTTVSPARNAPNALRSGDVALTFSQSVNSATANRIRIWGAQRGGRKAGVYSTNNNKVTFNPTFSFAPGEQVSVTVPATVVSSGGVIASKHVFQFTGAATGGEGTFANGADIAVGGNATAVATADVTGDGLLDVIACGGGNQIRTYPGNGDGTFGVGVVVGTVATCYSLAAADLDNDGDLDLLASSADNDQVITYLNTGAGTFGAGVVVSVGNAPEVIAVGDVDGDGDLDFVTNALFAGANVRLNNGTGTFSAGTNVGAPGFAAGVALGDVDGDGDLDLVVTGSNTASVQLNNGSGIFSVGSTVITTANRRAYLRDLDSDGDLDLIIHGLDGHVSISLNDGMGVFNNSGDFFGENPSFEGTVGDFDGDGDFDIALVDGNDNLASLWLNNGQALFAAGPPISAPSGFAIAQGDLDGDGDLDLLMLSGTAGTVSVRLNDNAFTVTARNPDRHTTTAPTFGNVELTLSEAINPTTAGQFRVFGQQSSGRKGGVFAGTGTSLSLDPSVDFAPGELVNVTARATIKTVGNVKSLRPHVYQFRAKTTGGTGTFVSAPDIAVGDDPVGVTTGDLNADGNLDLLTAGFTTGQATIHLGNGDGTFSAGGAVGIGAGTRQLNLVDLNADGNLDLLTANYSVKSASIRLGAGNGTFGSLTSVIMADPVIGVETGDIDGDGDLDLLISTFNDRVHVRFNNGSGVFSGTDFVEESSLPFDLELGDVDNDGDLDLLVVNTASQLVNLHYNNGAGTFSTAIPFSTAPDYPNTCALGDFDQDGDLDLFAGIDAGVKVYRNTGTGSFGSPVSLVGPVASRVRVADLNGDTFLDVLATSSANDNVMAFLNSGGGTFSALPLVAVGDNSQGLVTGDLDHDGDLDFVTANSLSDNLSVRLNSAVAGPAPTLTSFVPDHGVVGTVVTLTGTNFTGATAVTFGATPAPGFVVNGAGTEITATVPVGAQNGLIAVTTPDGLVASATEFGVDILVTGVQVLPTGAYHHVTVQPGGQASLGGALTVTAALAVEAGATLRTDCQVISGPGDFALAAEATLYVCDAAGISASGATGAVQVTGTRAFSAGADYVYNAPGAQVTGTGLPSEVRNLTISGVDGATLTQGTSIRQVLTLGATSDLSLNGQPLTLLSDINGTALVVNEGAGKVKGDGTAQCYLSGKSFAGLASHHLASPVSSTSFADLATPGFVPVVNGAYNNSPAPTNVKPYPNIFGFDETRAPASADFTLGYFSPLALAEVLTPTRGYSVAIKALLTPDFVGAFNTGNLTAAGLTRTGNFLGNTEKSGWHLLGNPYPAPLDWDLMSVPAGLSPSISVYSPTGTNSGIYLTRANGLGTLPDGILPLGQGFFARVLGAGPVDLTFTDAARVTSFGSNSHYRPAADPRPIVRLSLRAEGAAVQETDGAVLYFQEGATTGVDRDFDGERPAHNLGVPTLVSLTPQGEELAVNGLPTALLTQATRLPLLLDLPAAGPYELAVAGLLNLPAGTRAELVDARTGSRQVLAEGLTSTFIAPAAGVVAGRFFIELNASTSVLPLTLYPNPATAQVRVLGVAAGETVRLFDSVGRLVLMLPATADGTLVPLTDLTPGVYVVRAGAQAQRLVVR